MLSVGQGKAVKARFLCRYLGSEALRREIQDGLNVVETWNSTNSFIFYGKSGGVAGNRFQDHEVSRLGRSMSYLVAVVEDLRQRGVALDLSWTVPSTRDHRQWRAGRWKINPVP